ESPGAPQVPHPQVVDVGLVAAARATRHRACARHPRTPTSPAVAVVPSHTSTAAGSSPTSPSGVQRAGLAHHLIDLRDVLLFEGDLLSSVFFEIHALVHYEREQVVVLAKGCALVIQRFTQDLGDVVFVGLDQLADVERRMTAERRHVFAGHGRMVHTLRGLVAHPADDRNTRVAEDHQRVMQIADHARELELQNGIEAAYDFLGIDLVVFTAHDVLPCGGYRFSTQETL